MLVKPYGDTMNDGAVQLSFTFPAQDSPVAREAARRFVLKLGFHTCEIVSATSLSNGFTMFIAYGRTDIGIDTDTIEVVESATEEYMDMDSVVAFIREKLGRRISVVGACTGFDAHTVGIDAIMNMKGYNHHYGLERYQMIDAYNLGAQVPNEKIIEFALNVNADALLVTTCDTSSASAKGRPHTKPHGTG